MAAKFDGKHARANMWVTHQNLARAKGGRPGYQFQEKKVPRAPRAPLAAARPAQATVEPELERAETAAPAQPAAKD